VQQTTAASQGEKPEAPSRERVRIAPSSIVVFAAVFWVMPLIGLFFAQYVDILLVVFLAVLLSTFLNPVVSTFERLHLHRGVSILLIYILILAVLGFVGSLAFPLFVDETQNLANSIPADLQHIAGPLHKIGITIPTGGGKGFDLKSILNGGQHQVTSVAGQAVGVIFSVGQVIVFLLSILVMAFFLTVRKTFTTDVVGVLVPPDYRRRTNYILSHMGERMGHWALGQIVITIYYAVAFSLGLTLLNVPYALSVGVITGLLEIIPFVGGFIGVALAILVALSISPLTVVWVIILYLIVTNVEAHILVPLVYGRAVHLHPFLVIVALLVGAKAFGLLGALIAVPLAAALQVGVENLYIKDVVEAAEQQAQPRLKRMTINLDGLRRRRRQNAPH
jgi:predicted PurR-regulated permease PerM